MLAILIIGSLCFLSIMWPKSRILFNLILVYMWLFYAFNTYSGDYKNYEQVYQLVSQGKQLTHFEPLYTFFMIICSKLGLSFSGFRVVLATLYIFVLRKVVNKYTSFCSLAVALFMFFPFMWAASVLRAGIAGLFVMWAFQYLSLGNRTDYKKYLFWMIIAVLFHTSSLIFFVFLFTQISYKKNIVYLGFIASIAIALLYKYGVIYSIALKFTNKKKILQWLNSTESLLNTKGIVVEMMVLILFVFVSKTAVSCFYRQDIRGNEGHPLSELLRFSYNVYRCNSLMIVLVPLMILSDVWLRLVWEIFPLTAFSCINSCFKVEQVPENSGTIRIKTAMSISCLVFVVFEVLVFVYSGLPYRGTENDGMRMFFNNSFFSMFPF